MKIRVCDLGLSYDGTPILEGVHLAVEPHQLVALIGPNGSGKTTLLRAISGLLAPQEGAIYLDFAKVHGLTPAQIATELASIEQEIHVSFEMTVEEIVSLGRLPHLGRFKSFTAQDHAIVERAMQRTDIIHFAERSINTLSSGERQRVWLAMALAQEPQVLLLDEPTSHLDIKYQMEIMELIKRLSDEGLAVLASVHDLNLAAQFSDKIALIAEGQLLAFDTPEKVLTESLIERAYRTPICVARSADGPIFVIAQRVDHKEVQALG